MLVRFVCVFLFFVALQVTFSHVSTALFSRDSLSELIGTKDTLNVYPGSVATQSWSGVEHVLTPDLDEDSLYQAFSARNSAYVPLRTVIINDEKIVPTTSDITTTTTATDSISSSTTDAALESINTVTEPGVVESITESSTEVVPVQNDEAAPVSTEEPAPVEETSSEPEVAPTPTEESAPETVSTEETAVYTRATESVLTFFSSVTKLFPFTNAATTTAVPKDTEEAIIEPEPEPTEEPAPTPVELSESETDTDVATVASSSTSFTVGETETEVPATVSERPASTSVTNVTPTTTPQNEGTQEEQDVETERSELLLETYSITLSDFSIPALKHGEFIRGVQLRASLGAHYEVPASSTLPSFEIFYKTPSTTQSIGTILIDNEVSNALNGGHFLFALPRISDTEDFDNIEIEVVFKGDVEHLDGAYLDALWLEVETEVITKEDILNRVDKDIATRLTAPRVHEFVSNTFDFTRFESPSFNLRYVSQRNKAVQAVRSLFGKSKMKVEKAEVLHKGGGLIGVTPLITVTPEGLVTIQISDEDRAKLKPGQYTIALDINEGGYRLQDSFDFQWGMLAINSNQTEYSIGETAAISMGALTPNGNTLCDASLGLYIIDAQGFVSQVPVNASGKCDGNNVIDVPDYSAIYTTSAPGEYEMFLERYDESGSIVSHTSDTFRVVSNQEIVIERNGPTRIYPPSPYAMELAVHAPASFTGKLIERVPASFTIFDTDAIVTQYGTYQELVWDLTLLASTSKTVSYSFDAPDLSPYLYELGPARLERNSKIKANTVNDNVGATTTSTTSASDATSDILHTRQSGQQSGVAFEEHRQWQIASDATGNMILYWDGTGGIPAGWTCLSCGSGTFFQRFAVGSSTYNNTGGSAAHTPTVSSSLLTSPDATIESGSGGPAIVTHNHTFTPTVGGGSNLPSYRELRVIQYTASAGEPATIPAGAIGVFSIASSSLPANWNRYGAQDGYYVYGENSPGTTAGSNSHTHSITGTTGGSTGGDARSRGGGTQGSGATNGHTHGVTTAVPSMNVEPPYIEVLLAKLTATSAPPNQLISMWTDEVPSGWSDVSSAGSAPFNNKFIKAATTYGATGGNATHVHADTSVQSNQTGSTIAGRVGTAGADALHTHTINITNFSTENNLPPFVSVIYGKRLGTDPIYDQLSYRWYVNENAQTPTDPWPVGVADLTEREAITATSTVVNDGDQIRLRINTELTNATSTAGTVFKLQYAAAATCSLATGWKTVGDTSSSTAWRGYNNSSVSDNATLSAQLLASSTISETYQENGIATGTPNEIPPLDVGEWDFALEHNGASAGTNYCFRLVELDGTPFTTYSAYPQLLTNRAPDTPVLSKLFDNEKTASTSLLFQFVSTDQESEDVQYQIQIDDTYAFTSTLEDKNSITNSSQFENQVVPTDKAPFTSGELIEFDSAATYTNGTTYYWRVRAQDPNGSGDWGEWSTPYSFTIDTALTASAWFQTKDEQFAINTFTTPTTTGSDSVNMPAGANPDVSILDNFTTGNTKTISAGSGRLLVVGIHSADSGTNVNVNTVTYGGQALTEVYDEQVGAGFSNGMWVGYLDEAGIAAAVGTTITPTWTGGTPDSAVLYSSVVYENVDQVNPVPGFSANSGAVITSIQPTTTISVSDGDAATYFTISGSTGETHTPASGYTEGTEQDSNAVAANAYKLITADGTEQPTADWTNTQNRIAIVALTVAKNNAGTMISPPIDFDKGERGTAWDSLEWSDTETFGSISYQVQYLTDAATWTLIPDSVLSGNSAGFGTSPVSLLNLDTDTYNDIRLVANFTYSGGSPSLEDWTVKWGYRVETPTINKPFANEKVGTTTPIFEFVTTDPQNDSLTYEISWSTDKTFTASTTRNSTTSPAGFINIDSGGDTDPFNSGDTIQYTIQPADALTNNTTYWWRVRAKDTTGDNVYSFWTEEQSFTVDTTVVASTWFQTTEEQFDTNILSGTVAVANDTVSVATTATEALIVYGEGTETTPKYRQWNGTEWSSEGDLNDIGAPLRWAKVKAAPTREEYVAATVGTDADVNAQVFTTGTWSTPQEMTTSMGNISARGYDVAYETISGDAIVAYCDGDADPSYYVWDGSSWTAGGTINVAETTNCEWIQLASDPTSDEIIILVRGTDGNPYEAQVWNGATWGNSTTLGSIVEAAHEGMSVIYEESGDQAMIVASDGNPARFRWNTWNGSTWGSDAPETIGDDFEWGTLVSDEGSDEIALCYQDEDTNIGMARWSGSTWAAFEELLTTTGKSKTNPGFSCAFETTSGRDNYIMTAYTDTTQTNYSFWNNTAWSAGAQINSLSDTVTSELQRTGVGDIIGVFFDETNDTLVSSIWDGSAWSTNITLENNASVDTTPYGRPYSIAPRDDGTTGTTIVSPGIDFNDGSGPYWQEMSWVDSTPGTSTILYSLQYYVTASSSWAFVPNSLIPNNDVGTSTSPIDLTGLNKNIYHTIRPYATLSCDGFGNCPSIQDWTVQWAEGISISGTLSQYDESTVATGTIAVAVNGVIQSGKTAGSAGGQWTISNVNVFPGDIVTTFVNGAADANEAVSVTRYDGIGDISGIQLFERHLSLGSNDATSTPLTNADIGLYTVGNDEDVFFDVATTTLTVCADTGCGDAELFINASTTYAPGGIVRTHDIENNGILTSTGAIDVSGSWENNGTTTLTGSIVTFTATSTSETINEAGATSPFFNNLTFGTTTGAATWSLLGPLDVNGTLTVSRGTLARGSESITVAGNLVTGVNGFWSGIGTTTFDGGVSRTWNDQNATKQNIGNVVIDGTPKIITLAGNVAAESITIGANDTLDASAVGNYDITVYGDWTNNNTFLPRNGEVFFAANTSGNQIVAGSDAFYDITFTGVGGDWSFTEPTLIVNNNFTIATGTVTMTTATTSIAGSFSSAGGTFAHNNSIIAFTSNGVETITASGTAFTNAFYDLTFSGAGTWTFVDTNATSSHDVRLKGGTAVFPSGIFAIGGSLTDGGGTFTANGGTVSFFSIASETIETGGGSFSTLSIDGSGTFTFVDTNATVLDDVLVNTGTLVHPTGILTVGGSYTNNAIVTANAGTVRFNAANTGETVNFGGSDMYNVTFESVSGGWTITNSATTTNNFTLTSGSLFTLAPAQTLSVGATFTNLIGGASTTWTGSTLSLLNGAYTINTKALGGDVYDTLKIGATANVAMWNSSASTYTIVPGGSLYSQDHATVDGQLSIWGDYTRTSGTEYWSYATDFDGTDLSGGSERVATVQFAAGASAAIVDSIFEARGAVGATTTVRNQGAGTYTVTVSGGTTTAQYYDFADLGGTGVSLIDSTVVTLLRDGGYTVAAAGGTGITVSSTTIDANPALQIYNVSFATTTAIAATNVAQTDGAPTSYWWFRESRGNIDGESFDNDTGNPGSVRWDDSALVVTISGTVYSDDGVTPLGGTTCDGDAETPIRIVVASTTAYDGTCAADGTYSISGVTVVGDQTLTVFLNDASGGEYATAITKTPTTDISNFDLYANRVITRHEDTLPMTIADMAIFDSSNDSDVHFTAATGTTDTLSVFADTELHVWATTTFTGGGVVTLLSGGTGNTYDGSLHIGNAATFTGQGTTTYTIGGSFTLGTGATFIPASSTVLMTATTSGKAITTDAAETLTLNELQFTGVGGSWNLNGNISATDDVTVTAGTVTGTGDLTLTNGSFTGNGLVSLGGGEVTIEKTNTLGGTTPWTLNDLTLGTGVLVGTTTRGGTATTTIGGVLTIATGHYLDANASAWSFTGTGNVFVENGTFLEDTSTVEFSGTGGMNILSTDYYNLIFNAAGGSPTYTATGLGIQVWNNVRVGGASTTAVTFDTNDTALNIDGDFTITGNGTFIASNSGSFTLAGSYDNNGTFTANGSTLTFDGSGTETIAAGNSPFATALLSGTGDYTLTEHATSVVAFTISDALSSFTLDSGQVLSVVGTFTNALGGAGTTWTGSTLYLNGGGNYEINASTTNDTYATLKVGPVTQIRMWNSDASAVLVDTTASLYSMDNANIDGDLYIYGTYENTGTTDYWSYATDFDGTSLTGSERKVDVYVAGGGGVTYRGGTLSLIGVASASTTVQNQGSGTYGFTIADGASATMNYYELLDLDTDGLTFSGAPTIPSISFGYILVANDTDSAITVGGTVLNANPARTFTNNIFATSTGVTGAATNVTATGTSVSSWRFTNHSGQIDGEGFDVDPDGDPGYIVWDDSAASITISGVVYSDEGITVSGVCDGVTNNVLIRVAGLTSYPTNCNATTGAYSVSGITYSPGDSLVAYISGEAVTGATVSEDPVSNINNMDIYEDRVIVRHENTDPLSIADMAVWDSSDDGDIPFTAVTGSPDTLTLPADTKLIVWNNKDFEPSGNVTISGGGAGAAYDGTLELYTNASWTSNGTEVHSIGGSMILGTGATFTPENSTTTFTTTGAGRTIDINEQGFYNVSFTGSGSWTVTDATLTVENLSITAGTLTLPTGTTTVHGFFNTNGGSFSHNGGTMLFDGSDTGNVIAFGGSDAGKLTFNGNGDWNMTDTNATTTGSVTILNGTLSLPSGSLTAGGSFRNIGGAVTHNTSELIIATASAATLLASSSDLYGVTFTGGGTFSIEDVNATLLDSLTLTSGTLVLATGTLAIGGSFDTSGGTFTHGTGTILFNSADTGEVINTGQSPFYSVVFASAGGGWTFTSSATTTRNFTLTSASNFTMQSGTTLSVGNVFTNTVGGAATTWDGATLILDSASTYELNTKSAGGDEYDTLVIGTNSDISMWNSRATTTTMRTGASLYSQDHAAVDGALSIYGDYHIGTTTEYWSYTTDFDGTDLTGGSERAVTVLIADGATTTLDGGTLRIIGTSGNETTVTNQGSGTYDFNVTNGTFNAQYYAFRNLNSTGLSLSGTPVIASLSYGDFELAVNGGRLIDVSSTTLNANASLVIIGNRFATTTAITGTNVYLTGTTSNAWTFTSHTGNLSGEDFDVDGGSLCGSVRWDDSSCLLTQQTHYRWRNDDGGLGVHASEWFDTDWDLRKSVRIDNSDASAYTDAVVELKVVYDTDMQSDFEDLRFTDDSGTTSIPYFIASSTVSVAAEVWVKVPSIPSKDTATIYMYYSNATATTTSSSTLTFIAADDFEDGNIAEYVGANDDKTLFTVDGTFAYGGVYGLDNTGHENDDADDGGIARFDQTVSQGETIRFMQYVDANGGDGSGDDEVCTMFAVQSPVSNNQNYGVCLEQVVGSDYIAIVEDVVDVATPSNVRASSTVSGGVFQDGWHEIEVDWGTDNSIFVSVTDALGTIIATTSVTDSTYTSGGYGFTYWFNGGGWDNFSSRPTLTTEPSVRFGAEVTDGGASWKAAQDTSSSFTPGDVARLRLAIENSGLPITNQTFDLEYAVKGGAPSCEAVSGASYTIVPNQASCGTSPLCMATTSNYVDGAATADLLMSTEGAFVAGEAVESPSNTTGNIDIAQDEFTELEYAFTPTPNATDPAYCIRVTDGGSELDTYLRVAEFQPRFDPSMGAVTFNGGASTITLTGGTTTRVYATTSVTDLNGYADLVLGTSTMYATPENAACAPDDNNCYRETTSGQCSFTNCSGNSCVLECYADFQFHADPTDLDGNDWYAFMEVEDTQGGYDFGTSPGIDLITLNYLSVQNEIGYGALQVATDTQSYNPTTTIQNIGNSAIDINLEGTDLTDGGSSVIPVNQQLFATSSFTYSSCVYCTALSTTTISSYEVDLTKPTTTAVAVEDVIYWGIAIPFGIASNPHTGVNTFYAVSD